MTAGRRFEGTSCIVTGSTGIAAAVARALAAEGARLVVASQTEAHVQALVDEIVREGGEALAHSVDLAADGASSALIEHAVQAFGRLDALFNVAGISGRRFGDAPAHECTEDGWDTVLDVNARSMFFACRSALRQMLEQTRGSAGERGVILNMSSVLATNPSSRYFATHAYAASKGAIEAFSRAMAAYYAPEHIRVNVIAPALIATPMSERAQGDPRIVEYLARKQPLAGGPIDVADVVGTALFLLSRDARMVTGQVVAVDGGWSVTDPGV